MRSLLVHLVALALLGAARPSIAQVTAAAVEDSDAALRVTWRARVHEAVDVFVSDRPDAPASAMQLVAEDDRDGHYEQALLPGPRRYFLLRGEDGGVLRVAERAIPVEGGQNFRDIGGYRTADGRHVRWGLIYRSAALSTLTDQGGRQLDALGIRTVYDLRSTGERAAAPTRWTGSPPARILSQDYISDRGPFRKAFEGGIDAAKARSAMKDIYPRIVESQTPQFREVFAELLGQPKPMVYHCTAGKDRTGVMTALILIALGVPRETILADYMLSNEYYQAPAPAAGKAETAQQGALAALPPEVTRVFYRVEPEYLNAAFDEIDRRYGGVEAYLDKQLGVGPAEILRLRALYLE